MEYVDDYGYTFNDEQLDDMAFKIANEKFSDFVPMSDVVFGSTKPAEIEKSIISFQVPTELKKRISAFAKKNNCSISDYVRSVVYQDILMGNVK